MSLAMLSERRSHRAGHTGGVAVATGWLISLALLALLWAPLAADTLRSGTLVDNDDAMRLVQVREWLAGKSWYDLEQSRLNPPDSPISHWSRLIDMPIAAIMEVAAPFVPAETAERIALVLWPTVLACAFMLGLLFSLDRLFGAPLVLAAGPIVGLNLVLMFQFAPGRIDHHGAQLLMTLALTAATALALFEKRAGAAAMAAVVSAIMLAIGLETLPFVAAGGIAFALFWIVEGESGGRIAAMFGCVLVLATLALYGLTLPPQRWPEDACDALAPPVLWLAVAGGAGLLFLATLPPPRSVIARTGWAGAVAAFVGGVFVVSWPGCFSGPYGAVDPLVLKLSWLASVGEAKPILRLVEDDPGTFLFFLGFPLVGWVGLLIAVMREGGRKPVYILLFGFASVGMAITFAQMRGASFAAIFSLFGWLYLAQLALNAGPVSSVMKGALAGVVVLCALPFGWNAAGAEFDSAEAPADAHCSAQSDMAALMHEPPGLVLAPAEIGPRILVATPHSVLAAPYHRNNAGNRAALDAMIGSERDAREIVTARGVDYVAICAGAAATRRLAADSPDNFARMLAEGKAPAWLQPLPGVGPLRAWRVDSNVLRESQT